MVKVVAAHPFSTSGGDHGDLVTLPRNPCADDMRVTRLMAMVIRLDPGLGAQQPTLE
jgi:hypothetical protein